MEQEIQSNAAPQPEPASTDTSAKTSVNPGAPDVSNTPQTPTDNGGDANKGQNSQPSIDVFEKRFKDMERKYTRTRQQELAAQKEKSDLMAQLTQLQQAVQTLTKKPYSPADFVRDLQEKGPEAIFPLVEEKLKAAQEKSAKEQQAYIERIEMLETRDALNSRRADTDSFPDFRKLEDTMKEIWESEECPKELRNPKLDPGSVLDGLYQLAKSKHSQDAVSAAHADGKKSAEKALAKEAATTVATGGKAGGSAIPNPADLSTKQLRDLVAQMGGVVDRD